MPVLVDGAAFCVTEKRDVGIDRSNSLTAVFLPFSSGMCGKVIEPDGKRMKWLMVIQLN